MAMWSQFSSFPLTWVTIWGWDYCIHTFISTVLHWINVNNITQLSRLACDHGACSSWLRGSQGINISKFSWGGGGGMPLDPLQCRMVCFACSWYLVTTHIPALLKVASPRSISSTCVYICAPKHCPVVAASAGPSPLPLNYPMQRRMDMEPNLTHMSHDLKSIHNYLILSQSNPTSTVEWWLHEGDSNEQRLYSHVYGKRFFSLERHHIYFYHMSTRLNLHMHLTLPTLLYNYEHEGDRDVLN